MRTYERYLRHHRNYQPAHSHAPRRGHGQRQRRVQLHQRRPRLNGVNADTFLKLLVAQLQYQNPDNPVDSTQFLSQTADFEEVQELGSLQTSMASLVSSQQAGAATSMLGQQVTGTDQVGNP